MYFAKINGHKTLMGEDGKPIDYRGTTWEGDISPYNLNPDLLDKPLTFGKDNSNSKFRFNDGLENRF